MVAWPSARAHMSAGKFSPPPSSNECPSAPETNSGDYCWSMWEGLGNTATNLITATRTVIKAAAIVIFGCGVGWSMAEFETQQLALEMAPIVSGNQMPPLSSCEAVFRQSDLAKRLGEEFGLVFITPPVLCGDELLLVVPPPAPAPIEPPQP